MKISKKGRYALEAVVDLAINSTSSLESLKNIAQRQNITVKYLEQIFYILKQKGLIRGKRGINGGYCLSKSMSEITAGEIVRAVEGDLAPVYCALDGDCDRYDGCLTRKLWRQIMFEMNDVLDKITIKELVYKTDELKLN
jgi:Rrf2 family transcriptional regulator, cysteine metabolism repressor